MRKAVYGGIGCILSILITGCMGLQKKNVVFFGDSITQMGVEPGGYIDLIKQKYAVANTVGQYEFMGAGISGNKVYDLYLRMDSDVLAKEPGIVVIWIGVNDVWHKAITGTGTDADKFEHFYTALIKKMQAEKIKLILATPAAIGEKYDNTNPQDRDLNLYSDIIRHLALQYKCGLCDLRTVFMNYEKTNNNENAVSGILTTDGVHLNARGNELVAEAMMKSLSAIK